MIRANNFAVETRLTKPASIQLDLFDRRFRMLHERSFEAVSTIPDNELFLITAGMERAQAAQTFGEALLRSGAAVEQTFGGIMTRLWDDPFEWTLPEELSTSRKVMDYLNEVEAVRKKGFAFFTSDDDFLKQIPAPEQIRPIFDILLETLARAEHFQGRAFALLDLLPHRKPAQPSKL